MPQPSGEPKLARRARAGREAHGILGCIAVGPPAHQVIRDYETDLEVAGFGRQRARCLGRRLGANRIRVQRQKRIEQSGHMVLAHRVHGDERRQFQAVPFLACNRAQIFLEAPVAARDVVQVSLNPYQRYKIQIHLGSLLLQVFYSQATARRCNSLAGLPPGVRERGTFRSRINFPAAAGLVPVEQRLAG